MDIAVGDISCWLWFYLLLQQVRDVYPDSQGGVLQESGQGHGDPETGHHHTQCALSSSEVWQFRRPSGTLMPPTPWPGQMITLASCSIILRGIWVSGELYQNVNVCSIQCQGERRECIGLETNRDMYVLMYLHQYGTWKGSSFPQMIPEEAEV